MNDLEARVKELEAELVKAKKPNKLTLKVSPKGCIQVNGLRRFPAVYYAQEWARLFEIREEIEQFIIDHKDELTWK